MLNETYARLIAANSPGRRKRWPWSIDVELESERRGEWYGYKPTHRGDWHELDTRPRFAVGRKLGRSFS